MYRIGLGQDSHRLKLKIQSSKSKTKKSLILGGEEITKKYYPIADSDGDVILHSLCNALSTAVGGGSLDTWAGPMFKKGITDSKEFLKVILKKTASKGYKIGNVSIMLECQKPKLEKHRDKIQASLAKLLGVEKEAIGIAFTTGQDLTAFGLGKGIQAFSTILLYQ